MILYYSKFSFSLMKYKKIFTPSLNKFVKFFFYNFAVTSVFNCHRVSSRPTRKMVDDDDEDNLPRRIKVQRTPSVLKPRRDTPSQGATTPQVPDIKGKVPNTPRNTPVKPSQLPSTPKQVTSAPRQVPSTPRHVPSIPRHVPSTPRHVPSTTRRFFSPKLSFLKDSEK